MRKIICPVCEHKKRPYGMPRTDQPRAIQTHQREYEIGTFEIKCDKCGSTLYIRMDYIVELAPVDIKEVWASDGTPGEVIDEKRSKVRAPTEIQRVDPSTVAGPSKRK